MSRNATLLFAGKFETLAVMDGRGGVGHLVRLAWFEGRRLVSCPYAIGQPRVQKQILSLQRDHNCDRNFEYDRYFQDNNYNNDVFSVLSYPQQHHHHQSGFTMNMSVIIVEGQRVVGAFMTLINPDLTIPQPNHNLYSMIPYPPTLTSPTLNQF